MRRNKRNVTIQEPAPAYKFILNTYKNFAKDNRRDSQKIEAASIIHQAIRQYLDDVTKQGLDLPLADRDNAKKTDRALIVYYKIIKSLGKNLTSLPNEYNGVSLDFHTKNWPVTDINSPYYELWEQCVNQMASAYTAAVPGADLSAWATTEIQHEIEDSSHSDTSSSHSSKDTLPQEGLAVTDTASPSANVEKEAVAQEEISNVSVNPIIETTYEAVTAQNEELTTESYAPTDKVDYKAGDVQEDTCDFLDLPYETANTSKETTDSTNPVIIANETTITLIEAPDVYVTNAEDHYEVNNYDDGSYCQLNEIAQDEQHSYFFDEDSMSCHSYYGQNNDYLGDDEQPEIGVDHYDFDEWENCPATLIARIREMFDYGLKLEKEAYNKSIAARSLAISLYEDLKQYHQNTSRPSPQKQREFKEYFLEKLHSKDELMSTHRQFWKVILVNIALALSGIGLLTQLASLLDKGHGFFHKTRSQDHVNRVDEAFTNTMSAG